jgi:hypothetical protein
MNVGSTAMQLLAFPACFLRAALDRAISSARAPQYFLGGLATRYFLIGTVNCALGNSRFLCRCRYKVFSSRVGEPLFSL